VTAPDRQIDLAELITRYGKACADVEGERSTVAAMQATRNRRAELIEEFARRGFIIRSPL
jgi:hypothetical protein